MPEDDWEADEDEDGNEDEDGGRQDLRPSCGALAVRSLLAFSGHVVRLGYHYQLINPRVIRS